MENFLLKDRTVRLENIRNFISSSMKGYVYVLVLALSLALTSVEAVNNGLGLTPPMGYCFLSSRLFKSSSASTYALGVPYSVHYWRDMLTKGMNTLFCLSCAKTQLEHLVHWRYLWYGLLQPNRNYVGGRCDGHERNVRAGIPIHQPG